MEWFRRLIRWINSSPAEKVYTYEFTKETCPNKGQLPTRRRIFSVDVPTYTIFRGMSFGEDAGSLTITCALCGYVTYEHLHFAGTSGLRDVEMAQEEGSDNWMRHP